MEFAAATAACCSASWACFGSMPSRSCLRMASASSRACARLIACSGPSPSDDNDKPPLTSTRQIGDDQPQTRTRQKPQDRAAALRPALRRRVATLKTQELGLYGGYRQS